MDKRKNPRKKKRPAVEAFGQRVRAARDDAGLTQEKLAGKAGITSVQVSRVERGEREVRMNTILKLAKALKVSAADLLDGIKPDP